MDEYKDERGPAVVAVGSLIEGYRLIGPFATASEAVDWFLGTLEGKLGIKATVMLLESAEQAGGDSHRRFAGKEGEDNDLT